MGDRVYLCLTLHGHVKDSAALTLLVEQLVSEGFDLNDGSSWSVDDAALRKHFRKRIIAAAATKENPEFEMFECNYGNIEATEDFLQEHWIAYSISHGSGGEFSASRSAWHDGEYSETATTENGDAMIDVGLLRRALAGDDPIEIITAMVDEVDFAYGKSLPTFSVGGDLVEEVAVAAAKLALNIKEKAA
jgi:hypothetical protein